MVAPDTPAHFPNSKFSLTPNTIKNEKAGLNHLAYYQCRSDNTHRRSSCIRLLATVGNEKFQRAYKHRKRTGKTRRRKNIDALTIDSLYKELQCLRNNIKIYQTTIDSLNRENRQLKAEKNDALSRYQKATREADQLQKDNYELNEKVNLAARLEAINIEIRTLNKRGRKSTDKDKVSRLKINFSIARNTMAPTGEKRVYVCIKKPDGTTLVKDRGNTFFLAGKEYYYSLQQIIDYTGNNEKMYFTWQVEEYLPSGLYRIDIFADNQLIGAESFSLND